MTLSITAASVDARDLVTPRQIDGRACGRPRPVRSGQARATIISPAWALNRRLVASRTIPCRLISQALAAAAAAVADDDDDDNFSEELRRRRRQRRTVVQVQRQFPVTPSPRPLSGTTRSHGSDDVVQLPVGRKNRNQDL